MQEEKTTQTLNILMEESEMKSFSVCNNERAVELHPIFA